MYPRTAILVSFALMFASPLSAQAPKAIRLTIPPNVYGYVFESQTCVPLADLPVKLTPPRTAQIGQLVARTDQTGRFAFDYQANGLVYIEVFQGAVQVYGHVVDLGKEQLPLSILLTREGVLQSEGASNRSCLMEGGFKPRCTNPQFPSLDRTTIDQTSCTTAGLGGAEASQNEAKNNFCPTPGPAHAITIQDLISLQARVDHDLTIPFGNARNHGTHRQGPATDRKPLQALGEGTLVTLQGFVLRALQEGHESVNCGAAVPNIPSNHDIHISIVEEPGQDECSGVVAEMIPHHRPLWWTALNVTTVASDKLRVRVTGQLFFDSSHSPCRNGAPSSASPKRISLWEVHPVYGFDVCTQGDCANGEGWISLEEFLKK